MTTIRPIAEANRWHLMWREHGPNTYPIDLDQLVNEAINDSSGGDKLTFAEDRFDNNDFQGMFRKRARNDYVAILNSSIKSVGRKNFTKAHELFHFLGHRKISDQIICGLSNLSDYDEDKLEVEANSFASHLLLPPDKIRPYNNFDYTYDSVRELADKLGASVAAVAYKLLQFSGTKKIAFLQSRDGHVLKGYSSDSAYKRGIYFKSGQELSINCLTAKAHNGGNEHYSEFPTGVWHPKLCGKEYVHKTVYEDFTYTFLTFYE